MIFLEFRISDNWVGPDSRRKLFNVGCVDSSGDHSQQIISVTTHGRKSTSFNVQGVYMHTIINSSRYFTAYTCCLNGTQCYSQLLLKRSRVPSMHSVWQKLDHSIFRKEETQ